jgi:hypothetical protein
MSSFTSPTMIVKMSMHTDLCNGLFFAVVVVNDIGKSMGSILAVLINKSV